MTQVMSEGAYMLFYMRLENTGLQLVIVFLQYAVTESEYTFFADRVRVLKEENTTEKLRFGIHNQETR